MSKEFANVAFAARVKITDDMRKGGQWLGSMREWLKSNVRRGDTLTWDSGEPVSIPFHRFEELGLKVAVAAVMEYRDKQLMTEQRFKRQWQEAYAAFQGAFDTPISRQKNDHEYAVDARRRLSQLNEDLSQMAVTLPKIRWRTDMESLRIDGKRALCKIKGKKTPVMVEFSESEGQPSILLDDDYYGIFIDFDTIEGWLDVMDIDTFV